MTLTILIVITITFLRTIVMSEINDIDGVMAMMMMMLLTMMMMTVLMILMMHRSVCNISLSSHH